MGPVRFINVICISNIICFILCFITFIFQWIFQYVSTKLFNIDLQIIDYLSTIWVLSDSLMSFVLVISSVLSSVSSLSSSSGYFNVLSLGYQISDDS